MAKFAATDYNITIGGTDFSTSLAACTLDISVEDLETTPFGSGSRTRMGLQTPRTASTHCVRNTSHLLQALVTLQHFQ